MKPKQVTISGLHIYPGVESVERLNQLRSAGVRYSGPVNLAPVKLAMRVLRSFGTVPDIDGCRVDLRPLTAQHRKSVHAVYWHPAKGVAFVIGECLIHAPKLPDEWHIDTSCWS